MPNIKSAKKRVLTSEKKRVANREIKGGLKTAIKKVEADSTMENLSIAFKKIDKAANKNIIKGNAAARQKSRLTKKVNEAK